MNSWTRVTHAASCPQKKKKDGVYRNMHGHKTWGNLQKQVGFYEYGVSPFQLKTFKGFFNPGAFKLVKRTGRQAMFIVPPMVTFYSIAKWADSKFEFYHRKEYLLSEEGMAAGH